jgi:hypothetical protein
MSARKERWIIGLSSVVAVFFIGTFIAGSLLLRRLEPMVREQAIRYLRDRFHADVQLAALHIHLPRISTIGLLFHLQRGAMVRVDAEGLSLRRAGFDAVPLFSIDKLAFTADLGSVLGSPKKIRAVSLDGVRITVPPKQEGQPGWAESGNRHEPPLNVEIEQVDLRNATLTILPKDPARKPFEYRIDHLRLTPVGPGQPMNYAADLSLPKPPGHVVSQGHFGPWNAGEPGDTPLDGAYQFDNADLGVFNAIAGILHSTGEFHGALASINAKGEADVPDFRLTMSGNRVPLHTEFEALIDGANGNVILQPVRARLGSTNFTTAGAIVKHEDDPLRSVSLNVRMPDGDLSDLLRLAMKGAPFMAGRITLTTRIDIPPLASKVKQKLVLDGAFNVRDGKFLRSTIQSQLDSLSRHAQGQSQNQEIDSVATGLKGSFHLENQLMIFRSLSFEVPGAGIDLAGNYNLRDDALDFHGTLRLAAKVSQMTTGWKSFALKAIDSLFAKNGAGTFLHIVVEGDARHPRFGVEFLGKTRSLKVTAPAPGLKK